MFIESFRVQPIFHLNFIHLNAIRLTFENFLPFMIAGHSWIKKKY